MSDSRWSVAAAGFTALMGVAYLVLVGNFWGSGGLGVFSLCLSLYLFSTILCGVGLPLAILYEVAASGDDRVRASGFVYTSVVLSLIFGSAGGALGFFGAGLLSRAFQEPGMAPLIRVFAAALPLFLVNKVMLGVVNAHRKMRLVAVVNILRAGLICAFLAGAGVFKTSLNALPYAFILSETVIAVMLGAACLKLHPLAPPRMQRARRLLAFGAQAGLSNALGDLNSRLDVLVVGLFWDAAVVGVYAVAAAIASGMKILPRAIQSVTSPLIVQLHTQQDKEKLFRIMDVIFRTGAIFFFLMGTGLAAFIRPLIGALYPGRPEMLLAAAPLLILLPGYILHAGINTVGTASSIGIGRPDNALRLTALVLGANLCLNMLLVPTLAASGAAAATTLSTLAGVLYFAILCKRHLDFHFRWLRLYGLLLLSCAMSGAAYFLTGVLEGAVFLLIASASGAAVFSGLGMIQKADYSVAKSFIK